jgi:AcrR family transcriptional regulator
MNRRSGSRKLRADAERNITLIVQAAATCLSRRPDASMAEIAETAGVGRVTLYAHFPSREALLEAAIGHALAQATAALDEAAVDEGPAPDALGRMIRLGWPAFDRVRGLFVAAGTQPTDWARDHGAVFLTRVARVVERGRADGSFRSDLPVEWLAAALHGIVQTAGQEVNDGRLDPAVAADVLEATLLGILAVPQAPVGRRRD